jgi:hypothetical protein
MIEVKNYYFRNMIDQLVFVIGKSCVSLAVRTEFLNNI